ncbi:MAG: xanthine dehydrogenase family protein subunit [Hyphomicrobiales bacterium]|nr:xanthine dehydrogenase family protein subunit [Hyphomicrobiales bacterium]
MPALELAEPDSLDEAFALLADDDAVRPMGGGTALMLMMKAQLFRPAKLVSLRRIASLAGFALIEGGTHIRIGAMTTFSQLEHSELIAEHLPVVTQTMKTLANVRVRNVASVGGNLAHGDPHLDLPPVWSALGASIRIEGAGVERIIAAEDLFLGYYETALAQGELITDILVPLRPGWRFFYAKVTTRAEHDWPALGLCVGVHAQGSTIENVSLVLSAAVDKPTRLTGAEDVLRGAELSDAALEAAADAALAEVHIESDGRGSAAYKRQLLRVHLARAVRHVMQGSASA